MSVITRKFLTLLKINTLEKASPLQDEGLLLWYVFNHILLLPFSPKDLSILFILML